MLEICGPGGLEMIKKRYFLCVSREGHTALLAASAASWARCRINSVGKFQNWCDDWLDYCEEIFVDDLELFECEKIDA